MIVGNDQSDRRAHSRSPRLLTPAIVAHRGTSAATSIPVSITVPADWDMDSRTLAIRPMTRLVGRRTMALTSQPLGMPLVARDYWERVAVAPITVLVADDLSFASGAILKARSIWSGRRRMSASRRWSRLRQWWSFISPRRH
jgi:hypothetical protein